jgi:HSP20 family protein
MKLSYPLATLAVLGAADAHILGFQHGCAPCAAANTRPASTSLDMRRRRSPMARSLMGPPSPRSMFSEIDQMNELMERQFNAFFDEAPMMLRPTAPSPFLSARRARDALMLPDRAAAFRRPTYRYRIDEDEDKYTLSVELPGVKASDVNVSLEQDGRVLRISGMRQEKNGDMSFESNFSKDFVLNKDVHVEGIEAKLSEGIMTVVAPKMPKVEPKSISIPVLEEVPEVTAPAPEEEAAKIEDDVNIENTEEENANIEMKTTEDVTPDEEVVDLDENVEEKKDDLLEDGDILI